MLSPTDAVNAEELEVSNSKEGNRHRQFHDPGFANGQTKCHGGTEDVEQQRQMVLVLKVSLSIPRENSRIV